MMMMIQLGGAHPPYVGLEPVGGQTTKSVIHGQCDARPTVTFPASERHRTFNYLLLLNLNVMTTL